MGKVEGWKQHERDSAALIDGKRFPANQGGRVDVEGPWAIGQCKHVRTLSLMALTKLADEMHKAGLAAKKIGVVFAKIKMGAGRPASRLVVMHEEQWRLMLEEIRQVKGTTHGVLADRIEAVIGEVSAQDGRGASAMLCSRGASDTVASPGA